MPQTDAVADLVQMPSGIWTSLDEDQRGAGYDRFAAGYDALVGNGLYNRLVWGCPKAAYREAAAAFLAQHAAPRIIDFGCGSLVFTAAAYRGHEDRLTLFDRSLGMLERGKRRLPRGYFVQGDAFTPPFASHSFNAAMAWGMLHVFGTESHFLDRFSEMVVPNGPLAISSLVQGPRRRGNRMLEMLYKRGEAAQPQTVKQALSGCADRFEIESHWLCGSMLFVTGRARG